MFSKQANELQGLPMNIFFYTSMGGFQYYDLFKSQVRANFQGIVFLLIMLFYIRKCQEQILLHTVKTLIYHKDYKTKTAEGMKVWL